MFLLPGLVIGSYVTGMTFEEEERLEMIRYLFNRAHPEDGGWGMYVPILRSLKRWFAQKHGFFVATLRDIRLFLERG